MVVRPREADTLPLVDPNAKLLLAVARQRLKTVTRQPHQVVPTYGGLQDVEPSLCLVFEGVELSDTLPLSEPGRAPVQVLGWSGRLFVLIQKTKDTSEGRFTSSVTNHFIIAVCAGAFSQLLILRF